MDAIEADAEEYESPSRSANFLQRKMVSRHQDPEEAGKQAIIKLLKSKGVQLKSTLLASLATQIAGDPFKKIKTLIEELIKRLMSSSMRVLIFLKGSPAICVAKDASNVLLS